MAVLKGKYALVTGAASGIGRATALSLAREGATILVVDRDADGAAAVCEQIGGTPVIADFSQREDVVSAAHEAIGIAARIDILVNVAGIPGTNSSFIDTSLEEWDRIMAINLTAPFMLTQIVGRHMIDHSIAGRIVNVTSSSAHRAKSPAAYSSSKSALMQMTRVAAADFGPHNINVNAVAPGVTRTAMIDNAFTEEQLADALRNGPLANLLHRLTEPQDVAQTIAFLCSPASRQITGQTIHVSAGAVI